MQVLPRSSRSGAGTFLFRRVYVGDVATAVLTALSRDGNVGDCFNVVEA